MFTSPTIFGRIPIARLVDETGQVSCPLRARDVDVERCLSCPSLGDVSHDDRALTEIVCGPSLRALMHAASI